MLAIRSLARSAPRAFAQSSRLSARQLRIQPLRNLAPVSRYAASFSSSSRWLQDDALAVKLAQEISVEKDLNATANSKSSEQKRELEEFVAANGFELADATGEQEVALTKKHGDETIHISFSIADINNEPYPSEEVFEEEEDDAEALANQQSNSRSTRTAPEDQIEDVEAEDAAFGGEAFVANLYITITKANKPGALYISALTQDGRIMIEDFSYFKDAGLAQAKSFDLEKSRNNAYAGPPFGNLDEELQGLVAQYLAERGVDESLAGFVMEYIDFKEQKEYVNWLENVKNFVE